MSGGMVGRAPAKTGAVHARSAAGGNPAIIQVSGRGRRPGPRGRPAAMPRGSCAPRRHRRTCGRITRTGHLLAPSHVRTRHRPRDPRAAPDRHEDLLRLPHAVRRPAEHPRVPGVCRAAGRACPCSTAGRWSWPCARHWRSDAASTRGPSSPARITSIRTCRRDTRSRNTIARWPARARRVAARRRLEVRVAITRVHMEEDAGKSLHEGFHDSAQQTYIDYNRSGVPLIEIVTEPDLRSPADAATFFETLRGLLVWLGVNDGNMEEGSLRCDANVSVRRAGTEPLGTKTEVKNLNSFRHLQQGARARDRTADRAARDRRPRRAGDAAVGSRRGAHRCDAQQGGGARLPVFPGARSAAARVQRRARRSHRRSVARASTRAPGAFRRRIRHLRARCGRADAFARARRLLRGDRAARGQPEGGQQLDHG